MEVSCWACGWVDPDIDQHVVMSHYFRMQILSERAKLIRAAGLAHFIGLIVVGFYGTIGASGGFGNGAWVGTLAGGVISFPWFAALIGVIWFFPDFYWKHFLAMCVVGPMLVCGTWWLLSGPELIDAVAITTVVGSIAFLTNMSFIRWRRANKF